MSDAMRLTTARFVLRDFEDRDEPAFVAYQNDPRFVRYYRPEEIGRDRAAAVFRTFCAWAGEQPRRSFQLAVAHCATPHELIGTCGLRATCHDGEAEFGIELAPAWWGRYGCALEIAGAMLRFGFEELRLKTVWAETVSANAPANRLAERFGFTAERVAGIGQPLGESSRAVRWRLRCARWRAVGDLRFKPLSPPASRRPP